MTPDDTKSGEFASQQRRHVRAVLFDLGNTLVGYYGTKEFPAILQRCLKECRGVLGWPNESARDERLFGHAMRLNTERPDLAVRGLDERLRELFDEGTSLDATVLSGLSDAFLTPIFSLARVDPEATSVLESLRRRGIKTGIVSNTPWGSSASAWRRELARHGLLERVDAAVFCGDVGWRKPHPAPFHRALELIGVAPEEAIFVGDDPRWDVAGAQNAGLRPVLLRPSSEAANEACLRVDRLSGVLDLLEVSRP